MKIYTKIIFDSKNNLLEEKYFTYVGPIANCGIHYTFGANKGSRLMKKKAKKERKLAEKRAKKEIKEGKKERETDNRIDVQEPITLDFITNPNKDK